MKLNLLLAQKMNSIGQLCNCQFISHINQRGLRGNITFDVQNDPVSNISQLIIEAALEDADPTRWIQGFTDEGEFDGDQAILFDLSIHSNTLEPHMVSTCTGDDMGSSVGQEIQNRLTKNRPLILNKSVRWILKLDEFLQSISAKSLSNIIWGRSVRLRLSSGAYGGKSGQDLPSHASQLPSSSPSEPQEPQPPTRATPQNPKNLKPSSRAPAAIGRPHLAFSSTPSPNGPGTHNSKPTFAPRPKLSLTRTRFSQSTNQTSKPPQSLPKPEALVAASSDVIEQPVSVPPSLDNSSRSTTASTSSAVSLNTSTTVTPTTSTPVAAPSTAKSREAILDATNKRILKLYGNLVVCGNIIDTRDVKTAEAVFDAHIGGKVTIRGNEDETTLLMLNLYHIRSKVTTRHDWAIMASDILDNRREDEKCKYLQVVFDPNNLDGDSRCSRNESSKCRMGDLTRKHGQIQVAGQGRRTRNTLVDLNLPISALDGSRSLFMVVFEVAPKMSNNGLTSKQSILSCAPIRSVAPRRVEATFNMDGVRGYWRIAQRHPSEPAQLSYDLFGLENNVRHVSIRELPLPVRLSNDNSKLCSNLGPIFNPTRVPLGPTNQNGVVMLGSDPITIDDYRPTVDSLPVGNLSAKHGSLSVIDSEYEDHYMGEFLDLNIQLYGLLSIVGRPLLMHKNNGEPWVCSTLQYIDRPVNLAVANFFYPVVGQISFQQPSGDPYAETNVLVELYNPNGVAGADQIAPNHNWLIHLKPSMADFYNWSQRCESAGEVYDPVQSSIGLNNEAYARQCSASLLVNEPLRCRVGDTSLKSGFKLSLPMDPKDRSRHFYTDLYLPLSGHNSVVGRSVVVYDESAPLQRGNRLACSNIKVSRPLKASVRSWDSGPSIPSAVRGSAQFEQVSASRQTNIKLDLSGFNGNVEHYAVHQVWTTDDREFPCSNDSLYDIYDPTQDDDNSLRLPPTAHYGASATVDRVKVGDMSRKHGTLEGLQGIQRSYVDANLPLFAPHSIIGRSMVLRASVNDFRWVCGNVELDYDKSETRELIGLASFDDPRAKISGYVRFNQLEHKDGSLSDTFIQIDLRGRVGSTDSSGQNGAGGSSSFEHKTSEGHNWAVFVNQVGEDAYIAADDVRCIAAGFKWNPYLAQDTLDTYTSTTCTPTERMGCAMGDLGQRHGSLTLGPNNRRTISDSNLPLVGNYSVMGRSLVIFDNKRPSVKLACANIFPDIHLKSNVVIKRTPSFTVARFVEQMRSLLGASDWLMVPELRATKPVANGECVQMTIHFYGQRAHQMQVELNNLVTLGTVRKSTRFGVEKISTHYRLCRSGQAQLTSGSGTSRRLIYQDTASAMDFMARTLISASLICPLLCLLTFRILAIRSLRL